MVACQIQLLFTGLKLRNVLNTNFFLLHTTFFTARCYASAVYAVMQCLSVRPSVTFVDHVKTNKHIFEIFPPSLATPFQFLHTKGSVDIPTGTPLTGASNARGYDKMTIFSQISRSISQTVIDRWAHAARQFVSIEFSFHPYNIQRDCPRGVPRENKNVVKIAIFGLTH